jgi:hypothetical protein
MCSNRPPFPGPGEVYRQSSFPILWIQGIHLAERLVSQDLRPETSVRGANETTDDAQAEEVIGEPNVDEEAYDTDLEEDEDPPSDLDELGGLDDGGFGDTFVSNFSDGWEERALQIELELEESARLERERELELEREREREDEGERIQERLRDASALLELLKHHVDDAAGYPAGHQHLREIPGLDAFETGNFKVLLDWAKRRRALDNSHVMANTWDSRRRGVMFKN